MSVIKTQGLLAKEKALQDIFHALPQDDLSPRRKEAMAFFSEHGLPTQKHEDWQFTALKDLITAPTSTTSGTPSAFEAFALEDIPCLNICDGHLTFPSANDNMTFTEALPSLPLHAKSDTALLLNQALLQQHGCIAFKGKTNLWIRHINTQASSAVTHLDIRLAPNAQITIIETHEGHKGALSNHTLTAHLGDHATFKHYKWQQQPLGSQHFAQLFFDLEKEARLTSTSLMLGTSLCRQNSHTVLQQSGANSEVNTLYFGADHQHFDTHSFTRHNAPNCTSYQNHKGVLNDHAKGMFQGRIYVDPAALKTDGQMDNKVLLLSPSAEGNSKPQLEIYADDVKCSHGFTCGEMDKDQLFYMRSRGLPEAQAKQYLIYAFAADIAENIEHPAMTKAIEQKLFQTLA